MRYDHPCLGTSLQDLDVSLIKKELKENGNGEATFDFSLRTAFKVVENISEKYFEEGFGVDDCPDTTQKTTQKILEIIKNSPQITQAQLAEMLNITVDGVKYHIKNLSKKGIIKREGSDKAGKWIIIE